MGIDVTTGRAPEWAPLAQGDLWACALRIRRADLAFFKHLIESYEEIGLLRTIETPDDGTVLVAIVVVPDFRGAGDGLLRDVLGRGHPWAQAEELPEVCREDWFLETWMRREEV